MREPVALSGVIRAILLAAGAFGLNLTPEQIAVAMVVIEALLTLVVRQSVTPNATATELIQRTATTGVAQTLK